MPDTIPPYSRPFELARLKEREADIVLRPALLGVASGDFTSRVRAIRSGREAAQAQLAEIQARIAALTR